MHRPTKTMDSILKSLKYYETDIVEETSILNSAISWIKEVQNSTAVQEKG
mgnify:CR=1 FL=1